MSSDVSKQDQADMRELTEAETGEANGGIIPLLLGVLAFEAGMLGGMIAANYHYTGNFWGDID